MEKAYTLLVLSNDCLKILAVLYEATFLDGEMFSDEADVARKTGLPDDELKASYRHLSSSRLISTPFQGNERARIKALGTTEAERSPLTSKASIAKVRHDRQVILDCLATRDEHGMGLDPYSIRNEIYNPSLEIIAQHCLFLEEVHFAAKDGNRFRITSAGKNELRKLKAESSAAGLDILAIPSFNRSTILTGAGFSYDFGGYLAAGFFEHIIGHPLSRDYPHLRDYVLQYTNFEDALSQIDQENPGSDEARVLRRIIYHVFTGMDDNIRVSTFREGSGVNSHALSRLLNEFWTIGNDAAYVFTVNQDLLLERKFVEHTYHPIPRHPGVRIPGAMAAASRTWFSGFNAPFERTMTAEVSKGIKAVSLVPQLAGQYNYVKLHGSFDWTLNGEGPLVLGGEKENQIEKYELLKSYRVLFNSVLHAGRVRLLIAGYSFSDSHINTIIANAAENSDLEVGIWDTAGPKKIQDALQKTKAGESIWKALTHFCSQPVKDVMPGDQSETPAFRAIIKWLNRTDGISVAQHDDW